MPDAVLEVEARLRDLISKNIKVMEKNISQFGKTSERSMKKATRSVNRFDKATKSTVATAKGFLTALVGFQGIAAVANIVRNATRNFIEFDKAMLEVRTIMDESALSFEGATKAVQDLAENIGVDQIKIARGLYQTLSAGITDASDALTVLDVSSRAAIAGLTDTQVAVNAITTAMNAYEFSANDAERISDIFFETVKRGKLRFEDLSNALSRPIAFASQLGVGLEEVTAGLAPLA